MVTKPIILPEWENDIIFSKSEVGPRKSSYGFWGSAISSPVGSRAEPRPQSNIRNPGFYNGGSLQVMDQEFSKMGPGQGSGTKQMKQTLKQNVKLA